MLPKMPQGLLVCGRQVSVGCDARSLFCKCTIPAFAFFDLPGVFAGYDTFTVNLDAWVPVASARALPPVDSRALRGMRVTPADTRIARAYPSAYVPGSGRISARRLGKRSYLRNEDGTDMLLAFFDRPSRVEGAIDPETKAARIDFDIDIPTAGFYLLSLREESPTSSDWSLNSSCRNWRYRRHFETAASSIPPALLTQY